MAPEDSGTEKDQRAAFRSEIPFANEVLKLVEHARCRVSELHACAHLDDAGVWDVRIRLEAGLRRRFGLEQECLIVCDARETVELAELLRILEGHRNHAEVGLDSRVVLVVTGDSSFPQKVREWSLDRIEDVTVVPITRTELYRGGSSGPALADYLKSWLVERNPYEQFTPVRGEGFYGRRDNLRDLEHRIAEGNHAGIFGLRRIGKTSLLYELERRLLQRQQEVVTFFWNMQASSAAGSAAHLAYELGSSLARELSERSSQSEHRARRTLRIPDHWREHNASVLISDVCDGLGNLLRDGVLRSSRVAVIVDEIELLTGTGTGTTRQPMVGAVELLQGLRAVSQDTNRLSLVLAGVNAAPCEWATIAGVENPLFGFVRVEYLPPLDVVAARDLVQGIGTRINVNWTKSVTDLLLEAVGRHPLLTRIAAADVAKLHDRRPYRPAREDVRAVVNRFPRQHAPMLREILESLERHYPDELTLLRWIAEGEPSVVESYRRENPEAINHLVGYGLIDDEDLSIRIPVLSDWLRITSGS